MFESLSKERSRGVTRLWRRRGKKGTQTVTTAILLPGWYLIKSATEAMTSSKSEGATLISKNSSTRDIVRSCVVLCCVCCFGVLGKNGQRKKVRRPSRRELTHPDRTQRPLIKQTKTLYSTVRKRKKMKKVMLMMEMMVFVFFFKGVVILFFYGVVSHYCYNE